MLGSQTVITQLVFEHAMRIRVKAEADESEVAGSSSNTGTPATPSEIEDGGQEDGSEDRTKAASSGSSTGTTKPDVKTTIKSTPPSSLTSPKSRKSSNLIGRMNNLVTSDLEQISTASDFLGLFIDVPVQIAVSIVFLYGILGWSAFAGLAAIILILPVQTVISRMSREVQQMRSEKADERVGFVTEGMQRQIFLYV